MSASVREAGEVRVVHVRGRLTLGEGEAALREAVRGLLDSGHRRIVVSLEDVDMIDSAGIGELAACRWRVSRKGGRLCLVRPRHKTAGSILTVVCPSSLFDVYDDEFAALASF